MKNKKKNSKAKKDQGFFKSLSKLEATGDVSNTLIKAGIDSLSGAIVAPYLAAIAGKSAPWVGILISAAGHYLGDQSGISRVIGASTTAYGIAKAPEYHHNPESEKVENRMIMVKDELLLSFFFKSKKKEEQQEDTQIINKEPQQPTNSNESTPLSFVAHQHEPASTLEEVEKDIEKMSESFSFQVHHNKETETPEETSDGHEEEPPLDLENDSEIDFDTL